MENLQEYMKYAIASESITVDGVPLRQGFNTLTDREFSKLSRSKFKTKGIYELHDQEFEAEENKKAEAKKTEESESMAMVTNPSGTATELDLEAKNYHELVQIAKNKGINTKGLSKVKILAALEEL